ncbi:MAG: class I SAM-dependent methyltransferase [Phycisphaerales bacterium]|nr:MAG: class I SAM-dependent methyltransferase [Phycisphaerales bacterium]
MKDILRYIRLGSWMRLSRLGERIGWEWLMYNPGVFEHFHQGATAAAPHLADAVLGEIPGISSLVDVGCGTGAMAAEFKRRGVRVLGLEHNAKGRRWADRAGVPVRPFDLRVEGGLSPADGPFDLAMSTEVAEHLPESLADRFVDYLVSCDAAHVLLTAAHPGQGGTGHINEQPQSYWIEKFRSRGWSHDPELSGRVSARLESLPMSKFLATNLMMFQRPQT